MDIGIWLHMTCLTRAERIDISVACGAQFGYLFAYSEAADASRTDKDLVSPPGLHRTNERKLKIQHSDNSIMTII